MTRSGSLRNYLGSAAFAFLCAALCAAGSQERVERIEVVRLRQAEGTGVRPAELGRVEAAQRAAADLLRARIGGMKTRVEEARFSGHRTGLPGCRAHGERVVTLAQVVPEAYRGWVLYFVRAPRGGGRPSILPERLPEPSAVFVLEAASLADVGALSKILGGRVTLASEDFARAMGARCGDARVEFARDGRTALVREELQ